MIDILDVSPEDAKKVFAKDDAATYISTHVPHSPKGKLAASAKQPPSVMHSSSGIRSFRSRQFAEWSRRAKRDSSISPSDNIVIVSYFLPVILSKSASGQWSVTWDNENLLALSLHASVKWVGSIRYQGAPIPQEEEEAVSQCLAEIGCHPVFINASLHYHFYDIFCKQSLWLLLHQVADVYGPLNQADIGAKGQQDLWFSYSTVNRIFRDKVVEVFHQGSLVWIHGFHLMLLPSFLRRFLHNAKIGYFFHTPFPSSEIWRTITRREDLLRGILCADQIGFHLYEYARHFLTTCHRVLGHGSDMNAAGTLVVNVDGREVAITCIHVGVDLPRVQSVLRADTFEMEARAWRDRFAGKTIIAGVDRLERLKGIPLRLTAIDEFMQENEKWRNKLVFTIIGITAPERGDDYRQTVHDVTERVKSINQKWGTPSSPIVYFEEKLDKDFKMPQRMAYFAASDMFMVLATRDGLNRLPMEFTLSRQRAGQTIDLIYPRTPGASPAGQGIIIMSEFISSSRVMRGAIQVNPWRMVEVKNALLMALEMKDSERSDRTRRNLEFSTRLTTVNWATHVLLDLKNVEKNENPTENLAIGLGMGFRVMGVKAGFHALDVAAASKAYRAAHSRLLVLDWGGTLVAENDKSDKLQAYAVATGHASRAGPNQALKQVLESLCQDIRNIVFVVSGKELHAVSSFFGDVQGLGMGAEHGFFYRWPRDESRLVGMEVEDVREGTGQSFARAKWQTIQPMGDMEWKVVTKKVMEMYAERTHGTYLELKGNSLIWQYQDADPEFGFMQSKELENHLKDVLHVYDVDVLRGGGVADGYIEVRPTGVSKGLFIQHTLAVLKSLDREVDFVMAVGDDSSDEPMFEEVNRLKASHPACTCFSVTVGKKVSAATSYVDDTNAVLEVLNTLIKTSQRDARFFSYVDLTHSALTKGTYQEKKLGGHFMDSSNAGSLPKKTFSDGNLARQSLGGEDIRSHHKESAGVSTSMSIKGNTLLETKSMTPAAVTRTASNAHLSMSEYLDSIQENDMDDANDAGIFF